MTDNVVEFHKATKLYAGVPAIQDVDFVLRRGEIGRASCRERV